MCEFCMKIQRRSVTICAFQHFNFLTAMEKSRTVSLSHTEKKIGISFFFVLFFFPIPFIILALRLFLPSSCNSDPGSHSRLFSPPTHYGSCLAFLSREDFCSFFLVDSRRIVLTHARRSQQLILFLIFANKFNSRTNTRSIRGLPLVHCGDRLEKKKARKKIKKIRIFLGTKSSSTKTALKGSEVRRKCELANRKWTTSRSVSRVPGSTVLVLRPNRNRQVAIN